MYATHIPLIRQFALSSPAGLADTITFAVLSIRQPFRTVRRQMADVRTRGAASRYLWGYKRAAYQFIQAHASPLFGTLLDCQSAEAAVETLVAAPGLGLVKAGFVAQMAGFDVGCLDGRNVKRLALLRTAVRFDKSRSEAVRLDQLCRYVRLCQSLGGAERLWNDWCMDIGRTEFFGSAERVSAYHLECLLQEKGQ